MKTDEKLQFLKRQVTDCEQLFQQLARLSAGAQSFLKDTTEEYNSLPKDKRTYAVSQTIYALHKFANVLEDASSTLQQAIDAGKLSLLKLSSPVYETAPYEYKNCKIFTNDVDTQTVEQIKEIVDTDIFSDAQIRVMPDAHKGIGSCIGFTVSAAEKIIPAVVGVDIGCGVSCAEFYLRNDYELLDVCKQIDEIIKQKVPAGREIFETPSILAQQFVDRLRCKDHLSDIDRIVRSLGTLGGGNHFCELDIDKDSNLYLIVHTGSRSLGTQVANYYQRLAIKKCQKADTAAIIAELKKQGKQKEIQSVLEELKQKSSKIPNYLCYLEGKDKEDYIHDAVTCAEFAKANRKQIISTILQALPNAEMSYYFESVHNYVSKSGVIRKGAISAESGELVLIPLNMRDGIIIGTGKGNKDWNCSAPHGAGRKMSRAEARRNLSLKEFENSMKGIYSTTVSQSTIDEAPFAYKPSNEIIALIEPTVRIDTIIKPIYNFKAAE